MLFTFQIYPDEGHFLEGVKDHLYRAVSEFLTDCFDSAVAGDPNLVEEE